MSERDDEHTQYRVVVNEEEQYSIWPADREAPPGWTYVTDPHTKQACLDVVTRVWTDMRPRSLRERMERAG